MPIFLILRYLQFSLNLKFLQFAYFHLLVIADCRVLHNIPKFNVIKVGECLFAKSVYIINIYSASLDQFPQIVIHSPQEILRSLIIEEIQIVFSFYFQFILTNDGLFQFHEVNISFLTLLIQCHLWNENATPNIVQIKRDPSTSESILKREY